MTHQVQRWLYGAWLLLVPAGCVGREVATADAPLTVFNAGSLAFPLRAALDTFAATHGATYTQESAGSLETARKVADLGRVPDVIALADDQVFTDLLMPDHVTWFARFARNRMVLAYTDRSRGAAGIDSTDWPDRLLQRGVENGRSDPDLDPNGYRTLLVWQLAERALGRPGLAAALAAAHPPRNVRPKEADLVALLQAGELDYAWSYESLARATGLRYVRLGAAVDLGDPAADYSAATVRVRGRGADSVTFAGRPIVFALAIPAAAPHPQLAERFVRWLLSPAGQRVLRSAQLDAMAEPQVVGSGVPAGLVP